MSDPTSIHCIEVTREDRHAAYVAVALPRNKDLTDSLKVLIPPIERPFLQTTGPQGLSVWFLDRCGFQFFRALAFRHLTSVPFCTECHLGLCVFNTLTNEVLNPKGFSRPNVLSPHFIASVIAGPLVGLPSARLLREKALLLPPSRGFLVNPVVATGSQVIPSVHSPVVNHSVETSVKMRGNTWSLEETKCVVKLVNSGITDPVALQSQHNAEMKKDRSLLAILSQLRSLDAPGGSQPGILTDHVDLRKAFLAYKSAEDKVRAAEKAKAKATDTQPTQAAVPSVERAVSMPVLPVMPPLPFVGQPSTAPEYILVPDGFTTYVAKLAPNFHIKLALPSPFTKAQRDRLVKALDAFVDDETPL